MSPLVRRVRRMRGREDEEGVICWSLRALWLLGVELFIDIALVHDGGLAYCAYGNGRVRDACDELLLVW